MDQIKRHFPLRSLPVLPRLPERSFCADQNLPVSEGDDIGRRGIFEELSVDFGDSLIRDERNLHFPQVRQYRHLRPRRGDHQRPRPLRDPRQAGQVQGQRLLMIVKREFGGGHSGNLVKAPGISKVDISGPPTASV